MSLSNLELYLVHTKKFLILFGRYNNTNWGPSVTWPYSTFLNTAKSTITNYVFSKYMFGNAGKSFVAPSLRNYYDVGGATTTGGRILTKKAQYTWKLVMVQQTLPQDIAMLSQVIAQKKAEIARQLRIQQEAAAARKREAAAALAAAAAQARQAKLAAAQKKQLADMAAARLREKEARAREEARSKEIAATRAREVLRAKNIADARAREAAQAKEIARARVREANKTANAVTRAKILEGRQTTLARGAAASAKISAIRARADEAEAGRQDQIALYQEAQAAKSEAERSILNAKKMIANISELVYEATQAQRISKQRLIAVLKEIDKYDKLARSEYGKAIFEENRSGWMEAIKIAARALPEPDQIEIANASKKGKFGIVPFLIAGGAAYMYTTMQ